MATITPLEVSGLGKVVTATPHPDGFHFAVATDKGAVALIAVHSEIPPVIMHQPQTHPVQMLDFDDEGRLYILRNWELRWEMWREGKKVGESKGAFDMRESVAYGLPTCFFVSRDEVVVGTSLGIIVRFCLDEYAVAYQKVSDVAIAQVRSVCDPFLLVNDVRSGVYLVGRPDSQ